MDDEAEPTPEPVTFLGCLARLVTALLVGTLVLVGVVALVGVGTYVWFDRAANREREQAERRFERLERLEVFDVPIGGVHTGWSRTWPDEYELHILSNEAGSPFTALSQDHIAVPLPPVEAIRTYAGVLRAGGWLDVQTSCARASVGLPLRAEARAWTMLEEERTVVVIRGVEEPGGTRIEITVAVHGDQARLHEAGPCPATGG